MHLSKPAVGRQVHYVSYGTPGGEYTSRCRTATITQLGGWKTEQEINHVDGDGRHRTLVQVWDDDRMALEVHNPTGLFFNEAVAYDEGEAITGSPTDLCTSKHHDGGSWHWPKLS